jgi:hypothetical protein
MAEQHGEIGTVGPGWYPDPHQRAHQRWWDGNGWTSFVLVDGRTVDEAAPSMSTIQSEPLGDQHPGMAALYREPHLTYRELEPDQYGGKVEILGADGRLLATAEGDDRSRANGLLAKDVTMYMWGVDGARLGFLRRGSGGLVESHSLFNEYNEPVGQFAASFGTTNVSINTNRGCVGRIYVGDRQSNIVTPNGMPLVRCTHTENFETLKMRLHPTRMLGRGLSDVFVLEKLGPVPAWLFLFALWMPIEANLRIDIAVRN